ncbi:glycosyltransferase family 2 protein [Herminiimonas aquatilis]|uniref:Glycosyltransferase family 2 protein n=1 Tax=Herminiimonas aquatilis TaxID=345342 RepID=A0ABW2J1U5_9BURK
MLEQDQPKDVLPFQPIVLIPVYDHEHAIGKVVAAVLQHGVPCMLVDDGSGLPCARVLDALAAAEPDKITLVRHAENRGKGAAVLTGFTRAAADGYTHALQIDADGQHRVADIPAFLSLAAAHPASIIAGCPIYDESVPAIRLYCRYLTHVWVWINTLSLDIKDSMCGFRAYPVAPVIALAARQKIGTRMNFDTDIIVRLYWDGLEVINLPTRVAYPLDGVSHFRLWLDNVLITRMHATLFLGMLWRFPSLLARKWRTR